MRGLFRGRASRALVLLALASLALAGPVASAPAASPPPIKHVFIVVLENKGYDETFGSQSKAPYLSWTLPSMGALIPNYYSVTHQSLPNYIAMISGQGANPISQADCLPLYIDVTPGTVGSDGQAMGAGCVYPSTVKTVAAQLSAKGLTWKGYMQDMANGPPGEPKTCRHPAVGAPDPTQSARKGDEYAARHNPFVYFHAITDSPICEQDDVPLDRLPADLANEAATPSYAFITPSLCDDGHDSPCADGRPGGLVSADAWLRSWIPRILASPAYRGGGLLVVTFDESDGSDASACCNEPQFPNTPNNGGEYPGRGGGRVGAVVLSPYIDPGTIDSTAYNHFSLLRSVEDLFGLAHLGFAGDPSLQPFGSSLFTCFAAGTPHARRGRLPAGSEIKLAVIGQGTARKPLVEIKLWHPGRVTIAAARVGGHRLRPLGRPRAAAPCQLLKVSMPYTHGRVVVSARAYGGSERRTLTF